MAIEKPIISTHIEGWKDVIKSDQNGIYVYTNKLKKLAVKITE